MTILAPTGPQRPTFAERRRRWDLAAFPVALMAVLLAVTLALGGPV
jgi:hypothetical protein